MQLLIVHHDAEVGEQLAEMVREYTEHQCALARSAADALTWARGVPRCSLLVTQLDGEGVNGLSLGGTMSEMFAGLQTMFLPAYAAAEERVEVPHRKVFPEPIDGQRLLDAITRAEVQRQTGMDLYHALDVVQMCCLSRRSGALQLVNGSRSAVLYLQNGDVVHGEHGVARGNAALDEVSGWANVEFAYDYALRAPAKTIAQPWDEAVVAAVARRKARDAGGAVASSAQPPEEAKPPRRGLFGATWKHGLIAFLSATSLSLIAS